MTILIADAGATKTDWVKITYGKNSAYHEETYTGVGISPVHHDIDMIEEELRLVRVALGDVFDKIRFYGTGIGSPMIAEQMITILSEIFVCRDIAAESDMSGAAKAVLGNSPGIACIMGTGSNSCHYDGEKIDRKSASLGYILDDEGGGVAYGRRLLSDIYKGIAPKDIIEKFNARYNLPVSEVVNHLYRQPSPNRWIAGFMKFILDNSDHEYIKQLILSQTEKFLDREFITYTESELKEEGIGFVGSVAVGFKDQINVLMQQRGWRLREITARPISRLVKMETDIL